MRYPRYVLSRVAAEWLMRQKGLPFFKMGDEVEVQSKPNIWINGVFWHYSLKGMAYYYDMDCPAGMILRKTHPEHVFIRRRK